MLAELYKKVTTAVFIDTNGTSYNAATNTNLIKYNSQMTTQHSRTNYLAMKTTVGHTIRAMSKGIYLKRKERTGLSSFSRQKS